VTFDTRVRRYIPPRARPRHLKHLLSELSIQQPGDEKVDLWFYPEIYP